MSSFFQRFKYSYDKFLHKINFNEYYQKLLTPYNIRLIAYAFIITRIYKIYQLVLFRFKYLVLWRNYTTWRFTYNSKETNFSYKRFREEE